VTPGQAGGTASAMLAADVPDGERTFAACMSVHVLGFNIR
jgi:hypothetical protein